MEIALNILRCADGLVVRITRLGVILGMATLFILLMIRIIARATEIPFAAFDEIGELATVWMILCGVVAMWRKGSLYSVEFVAAAARPVGRMIELAVQVLMFAFAILLAWVGGDFTLMSRETSAFMQIDMTYYYGAIPVAGAVMAAYSVRSILDRLVVIGSGGRRRLLSHPAPASEPVSHL